jgi:myosin heavy subunit
MANTVPDTQLEFDLGADEKPAEITLDEPSDSSREPMETANRAVAEAQPEREQREELDHVSEAVQKRIAKLTARMRESERREQAALEYARGLQNQAQELQQKLVHTDYSRLNEAKTRLETQQATLKAIIKKAREENDIDTETEATQRLSELVMEQRQVSGWLQTQEQQIRQPQQAQPPAPPQQAYQPQAQPQFQPQQAAAPSPKAEEWASRNKWFGQDRVLTYAAWGIHQTLLENEGFDPSSDEYYTELDRRLREEFPKRFPDEIPQQTNRQQRSAPAVAPATRSSGINSARRTVRLSPSQVAIAKKLNVPLEEYAKYVKE